MKKLALYTLTVFLFSCGGAEDKASKLEALKTERDNLSRQISLLEKEVYPEGKTASVPVMIDTLRTIPFSHCIEVQGKVDGNENIGVSPRTPGVVNRILVKEGDNVVKGQILAELDAEVLKQTLKELESQLAFATELYEKQKALWDQKIGSEVQFLTSKNNKESLENKIATIQDQIKMSNITSPIDGTVEEIPIKVGEMAAVGFPAFRVVNFNRAKVIADVGEAYSAKIKTGDQVQIYLPDLGKEFDQRVTFASKYIDPVNRTFVVEAALPSNHLVYRANMIAILRIKDYENPQAVAIPRNYIQSSRDEGEYVFVAEGTNGFLVAKKQYIKPGITYNGLTEIREGLSAGDLIITAGYQDLYDNQPIHFLP
ncbi:MAG: efflux RND transporter periplasmic adaptor subunit [Bacteroidales bacterium]|nr:efflux RND transporter periplasmic adaptor subunit [Bacteroidales bacterium]